ncbi:MAG: hypothetical protein ETSY2_22750 [Candidatus Entotheonella gemina]|uniref:Amidohydrolase-related domain-containing protein n=1 Tax=Candidatus Entotheonella gemina TaxID=1429439 RepID=W4M762_9BACT|nr:MAG: hypothetical protein ETSY2_22750 [Candidatus Entotheonella gemina]
MLRRVGWLVVIVAFIVGGLTHRGMAQVAHLVIVGARIYPSPTADPIDKGTVIVRDGRIAEIRADPSAALVPAERVIQADGLVVTSGFWNCHVHFTESKWANAHAFSDAELNRRERAAITLASVVPDLDGLGIVAEVLTRSSERPLLWRSDYHHVLGHNLCGTLLVAVISGLLATRRRRTAGLAFLGFHLHLLGDLIGGRGLEGFQWPIHYLYPFSQSWQWTWAGQWALNAWPNMVLTAALLLVTGLVAWKRGVSPLELVSTAANQVVVSTLRRRFPCPS